MACSIPVTCIETGRTFTGVSQAAQAIGLKPSSRGLIYKAINGGGACRGLHFVYGKLTDEELQREKARLRANGIPIFCEIGQPVVITHPGLIECMPVPAAGIITSVDIDHEHPLTVRSKNGLVYYLKPEEVKPC